MPYYTAQQLATISLLAGEIKPILYELHDYVFGFNDGEIYMYDLFVVPFLVDAKQKCFKPANLTLQADAIYWHGEFVEIENIATITQREVSIQDSNRFIYVIVKFIAWCDMVTRAYLSNDILAYHNKIKYIEKYEDYLITKVPVYKTEITEPTTQLTPFSEVCEYFDSGALRTVKGYFKPQKYQEKIDIVKQKAETIKNLLEAPQADPSGSVQPIQLNQTGTNKLLKILGELFLFIKSSLLSLNQEISKIQTISNTINGSLHDMRSVELAQARQILQDLRGENNTQTISTQLLKYTLDRQSSLFIIGSEGNYYPIGDVQYFRGQVDENGLSIDPQTMEPINIVRLSTNNGIIFSLKRLDDNNQVRYQRINDVLYEINFGISQIKPTVENIDARLSTQNERLTQVFAKIEIIEALVNEMMGRI